METGYQRGRIQDESMLYEHRKHDGSLPIIGVNTFRRPASEGEEETTVELARAPEPEKKPQLQRAQPFPAEHPTQARQETAQRTTARRPAANRQSTAAPAGSGGRAPT